MYSLCIKCHIHVCMFLCVVEVIQTTDPDFKQSGMFSGGAEISAAPGQANATGHRVSGGGATRRQAYVKILEQPASKALRYI